MKKKEIIRTFIFLILLVLTIVSVQPFFIPFTHQDTRQAYAYYNKKDYSEDILIVGASGTFVGLSPLRIYETTGLTAYNMGNSVQYPMISYLNVKESLDRGMKPRLVIVNAKSVAITSCVDENEPFIRRGMDYKKLTLPKLEVIMAITGMSEWQNPFSYIFPMIRYHSRWLEMTLNEDYADALEKEYAYQHGQWPVYKVKEIEDVRAENWPITERSELSPKYVKWFKKLADLCNENGIPVLLVNMPDIRWTQGQHDTMQELTDSMGDQVDFFDFSMNDGIDKAGLDLKTDFYDDHHVNSRGSLKTTDYIMEYITDKYDLHESQSTDELKKQNEEDLKTFQNVRAKRKYTVIVEE